MGNFFDEFDAWMRRGADDLNVPDTAPTASGSIATGNVVGSASTSTVNDTPFPESASLSNPMTGSGNPANFTSGSELGAILAFGKKSFTDTTAGWIQGMDSDGIYKWLIGGSSYSIDWSVTTSGVLTLVGAITATTGSIGGFNIGSDYIRDVANSMGLASTVSGSDDVRFWAGDTYANRTSAPFRVTEAGAVTMTSATISGYEVTSPKEHLFSDGSDGNVTISGTTTLTKDMYYLTLTVNGTLNTAGYRVFAKTSITVSGTGTITFAGNAGGNGGNGAIGSPNPAGGIGGTAGAAGSALSDANLAGGVAGAIGIAGGNGGAGYTGTSGVAGAAGANGNNITLALTSTASNNGAAGVSGGAGGNGGSGGGGGAGGAGSAGTGGTLSNSTIYPRNGYFATILKDGSSFLTTSPSNGGNGGSGGGGGGGIGLNEGGGGGGAGGCGGGGSSGGVLLLTSKTITVNTSGVISTAGGVGGTGGNGANGNAGSAGAPNAGGGGGGGGGKGGNGGNGGVIVLVYQTLTNNGSITVAGGAGGSGGAKGIGGSAGGAGATAGSDGTVGTAGSSGNAGTIFQLQI